VPNLHLQLDVEAGSADQRRWLAEGIEIFPKHDEAAGRRIWERHPWPLGIHRGANRRYWFYGADYALEKQVAYI